MTNIFGTISLGQLAVDGFFLISGYLIYQSYDRSANFYSYLAKRAKRIYPAFIVASLVSIFIFAPISAGWVVLQNIAYIDWFNSLVRLITLLKPKVEGVYIGNPYPTLNGAMWTISYEFFCYLIIPFIAYFLYIKKLFLIFLFLILISYVGINLMEVDSRLIFYQYIYQGIRLISAFMVGVFFYKFRSEITWSLPIAVACFISLILLMLNPYLAEPALILFGGYLLFYFAFNFKNKFFNSIGSKNDVSYGVYLYAWPIQSLIAQFYPTIQPAFMTSITIMLVTVLGYLSWVLVESRFLRRK